MGEEKDKDINLMPEDLRSKEDSLRSQKKKDHKADLVRPDERIFLPDESRNKKTILDFIKGLFSRKPRFGDDNKKPKKEKKHKEKDKKEPKEKEPKPEKKENIIHSLHEAGEREPDRVQVDYVHGKGIDFEDKKPETKAIDQESEQEEEGQNRFGTVIPQDSSDSFDFSLPEEPQESEFVEEEKDKVEKTKNKEQKFHEPEGGRIRAKFVGGERGVDLIPIASRTRGWPEISKLFGITLAGAILIVGGFYGYLFFEGENIKMDRQSKIQQISDLEIQVLNYSQLNNEIEELGNQIRVANNILNQHIYWTNFFQMLEKYTLKNVRYQGISAGNQGALTLVAATDDFDAVAKQLKVLQGENAQEFVQEVMIYSASKSEEGVEFEMTIVLVPDLFYYQNQIDQTNTIIEQE